jgi:hypothetical protein
MKCSLLMYSSSTAVLMKRNILVLSFLLCSKSSNQVAEAFSIPAGACQRIPRQNPPTNSRVLAGHSSFSKSSVHLNQLQESRTNFHDTDLEILEMKRRVLALSLERDDEIRRKYVSKWITSNANKSNYCEGTRLIHLWDKTVIQLGEEFQQNLRFNAKKKFTRPCSFKQDSIEKNRKEDEHKLTLWAFVDMLVQTKTLMNKLEIPKQNKSSFASKNHRRINNKVDSWIDGNIDHEESIFQ